MISQQIRRFFIHSGIRQMQPSEAPRFRPGNAYSPIGDSRTVLSAAEKAKPQPGLTPG